MLFRSWGLTGDGNDTFHGGSGDDTLALNLDNVNANTIQDAYDNGDWTIELKDADGNEIAVTDDMWNEYGNLNLPDGATGVITGSDGETMTFDGVESITGTGEKLANYLVGGSGTDVLDGGEGDDIISGGHGDGADDVAHGGAGDDVFIWGFSGDGNDTFHGGEGNDTIKLDLSHINTSGEFTLQDAFYSGGLLLYDADGNETTNGISWDTDGNMNLPDGFEGSIMGPHGKTITFDGVEKIIF